MQQTARLARVNNAVNDCLQHLERLEGRGELRVALQVYLLEWEGALPPEELRTVESVVFRIVEDRETARR